MGGPASINEEFDLQSIKGSVVLAFIVIGVLSFTILRVLALLQAPRTPESGFQEQMTGEEREQVSLTEEQLSEYNGSEGKAIYVAVKDPFSDDITIFDMTSGESFYGPGGPYHVFAGKNATHGLAKSSTDPADVTGDLTQLSEHEKDTHMQWYAKFSSKYPKVGRLVLKSTANESKKDN